MAAGCSKSVHGCGVPPKSLDSPPSAGQPGHTLSLVDSHPAPSNTLASSMARLHTFAARTARQVALRPCMPSIVMKQSVSRRLQASKACTAQGVARNGRGVLIMRSMRDFSVLFERSGPPEFEDRS